MTRPEPTTPTTSATSATSATAAAAESAMPLIIERAVIEAALRSGAATILSPLVTGLVRYQNVWWIDTTDAWAQITDPTFTKTLEARHARGTWT